MCITMRALPGNEGGKGCQLVYNDQRRTVGTSAQVASDAGKGTILTRG